MLGAANYNSPLAIGPTVDEYTSQTNMADLIASQSSPEELEAAYARVESRCVQSISRNASPCNSQYSSQCNTPVSATFPQNLFGSKEALLQPNYYQYEDSLSGYGDDSRSMTQVNNGTWEWANYAEPYSNKHHSSLGRSASCRW